MPPTPLPPEWLVRISRSKGKVYYYHPPSHKTQWSRPTIEEILATPSQNESAARHQEEKPFEQVTKRQKRLDPSTPVVEKRDEDVLDALILASMRVGGTSVTRGTKRAVVFTPWPHQLTAVKSVLRAIQTRTIEELKESTETEKYLLQHSTGAGKTLTIAALTHQLLFIKDARSMQFHTVVVMLDRVKLNEQVGDTVKNYLNRNGVDEVFRAESIEHLAKLLDVTVHIKNQKVIITTTHKMGLLVKDKVLLTRLLHRSSKKTGSNEENDDGEDGKFQRVAIILDEAHRSHTSSTRDAIETVMKAGEGSHAQLTFIGFTATPNSEALELFGSQTNNGFLHPFHCYPMAQAAADGRIMDILKEYTCVRYEIETSVFPRHVQEFLRMHRGTRRHILDYANDDVAVLKGKALIMMTDFQAMKQKHPKIKCMIVVRSRQDVVRYYTLITTFIAKKKLGWNCYAAFSGAVALDGEDGISNSVTEPALNNRSVTLAISDVIIVCDKLDTGYNEPLLACMYVDRYLRSSAHTVQLLSRLNRRHKNKASVRVLDFANHAAQVRRNFADFWREAKAPISADVVDETAERLNLATSIVVLCDYFPELRSAAIDIEDLSTFVSERVVPIERDAFQQVIDALREAVLSFKRLEQAGCSDFFDLVSPFSYYLLCKLKKETESHVVTVKEDVEPFLDNIKTKMSARLEKYGRSFSGALYPQSLLDRADCGSKVSKLVSCLLQFGELEHFEALLLLTSARNDQQSIDASVMTQMTEAASKCSTLAAFRKHSAEAQPRLSAQIDAMQKELTDFLQTN